MTPAAIYSPGRNLIQSGFNLDVKSNPAHWCASAGEGVMSTWTMKLISLCQIICLVVS